MKSSTPTDFYKNIFLNATPEQQAAFLEQLFAKDADLQEQFQSFIASCQTIKEKDAPPTLSFVNLDELQEEVREVLKGMDFDFDSVYHYFDQGDRSYVPDYEAAWEGAENMLREEVFEVYGKQAKDYLKKGNLLDGVKILLGMYEGHCNVYEPGSDETYSFEDNYNDTLSALFKEQLQKSLPFLSQTIMSDAAITQVFDLIVKRVQHWEKNYDKKLYKTAWEDRNVVYGLKLFEPLLLTLLTNSELAVHLEQLLLENNLKNRQTAKVFLKIAKLKGNQKDWAKTAEAFASEDQSIMQQLLEHYHQERKENDLYRIANKSFQYFANQMHGSILELIEPEKDETFYVKVLTFHVQQTQNVEHYRKLCKYLNLQQRNAFIDEQKNWMDFYVALLAEEGRHEAILDTLKKHPTRAEGWSSVEGDFYNLIVHILEVYPSESFDLIRDRVDKALEHGRGRHVYATVTHWMQRMLEIKGYEAKSRHFIKDLMGRFYNFRALKDEMRKGGVI